MAAVFQISAFTRSNTSFTPTLCSVCLCLAHWSVQYSQQPAQFPVHILAQSAAAQYRTCDLFSPAIIIHLLFNSPLYTYVSVTAGYLWLRLHQPSYQNVSKWHQRGSWRERATVRLRAGRDLLGFESDLRRCAACLPLLSCRLFTVTLPSKCQK